MENATKENINLIFGLKVKELRNSRSYSLQELSERSGISISYLNEIEKGKKYPKTEKIADLAKALDVPYDQLVSLKLGKTLSPVGQILNLDILNELPFETFGLDKNLLTGIIANAPLKVAALVNTLYEISRNYNLKQEHFYFAALRSFQELNDNYFDEIETAAEKFITENGFTCDPPVSTTMYVHLLQEKFGYKISATDFADFPALQRLRSVLVKEQKGNGKDDGKQAHLLYNSKLTDQQKTFLFGRELGFSYLKLDKRPLTTSWLKVESFDHVLNNFKASYFAQCLHINKALLLRDLETLFANVTWDASFITSLLDKYQASPEMLFQRMSNLLPKYFGFNELFFVRYSSKAPEKHLKEISKELHISRQKENFEARQLEQHFQRWVTKVIVEHLKGDTPGLSSDGEVVRTTKVFACIATHPQGHQYFVLSVLRPMPELNNNSNSITIGFQLSDAVKKKINFLNDTQLAANSEILKNVPLEVSDTIKKLDEQRTAEEAYDAFVKLNTGEAVIN